MATENSALGFCDESKSMSMIKRINKTHSLHAWRRPSDLHRKRIETYQSTIDTLALLYAHPVLRYPILSSAPFSIQELEAQEDWLNELMHQSCQEQTWVLNGDHWVRTVILMLCFLTSQCFLDSLLKPGRVYRWERTALGIGLEPLTASPQPYKACRVTQPFFLWGFCFCFFVTCQLIVSFSAMEIVVFCKPLNQLKGMVPYYRAPLCCRWDWAMRKQSRTS